jgi:hypothetical protein
MIAQIVQILANGLRRDLETPGEIFHHHPAKGTSDIENFRLAVSKAGHICTSDKNALYRAAVPASGQRGRSAKVARWPKDEPWLKRLALETNHDQSRDVNS